jgi:hypothetical protein
VFQDLVVADVTQDGACVTVHVLDATRRPHRITFHLADRDVANGLADQVMEWQAAARPVSYVRNGGHGALIDERVVFERAMGGDGTSPM